MTTQEQPIRTWTLPEDILRNYRWDDGMGIPVVEVVELGAVLDLLAGLYSTDPSQAGKQVEALLREHGRL